MLDQKKRHGQTAAILLGAALAAETRSLERDFIYLFLKEPKLF